MFLGGRFIHPVRGKRTDGFRRSNLHDHRPIDGLRQTRFGLFLRCSKTSSPLGTILPCRHRRWSLCLTHRFLNGEACPEIPRGRCFNNRPLDQQSNDNSNLEQWREGKRKKNGDNPLLNPGNATPRRP